MSNYWVGTFLSAVMWSPSTFQELWPELIDQWFDAGCLSKATAWVRPLEVREVTYGRLMSETEASSPVTWTDRPKGVHDLLRARMVDRIIVSLDGGPIKEISIDNVINEDNSVSMYVNVPYGVVYDEYQCKVMEKSMKRFMELACALFVPSLFPIGYIGEEARIDGKGHLINHLKQSADWSLLGVQLASLLEQGMSTIHPTPLETRHISNGGMFVRWTDWRESPKVPTEWLDKVRMAIKTL